MRDGYTRLVGCMHSLQAHEGQLHPQANVKTHVRPQHAAARLPRRPARPRRGGRLRRGRRVGGRPAAAGQPAAACDGPVRQLRRAGGDAPLRRRRALAPRRRAAARAARPRHVEARLQRRGDRPHALERAAAAASAPGLLRRPTDAAGAHGPPVRQLCATGPPPPPPAGRSRGRPPRDRSGRERHDLRPHHRHTLHAVGRLAAQEGR
mmetsp:Transcript_48159/g.119296  ORF Transcript_48159/g.119296 Transcript_48159/m.119296 type:complete len:207 (+) Transcript_48159:1103-1723(+)